MSGNTASLAGWMASVFLMACASVTGNGAGDRRTGSGGSSGAGGGNSITDLDVNVGAMGGSSSGDLPPGEKCEGVVDTAEPRLKPQDIIIVIDSSGSMDDEMQEIENRINESLGQVLDANGIDYRVILIARYGNSADREDIALGICIGPPLGTHDCSDPLYSYPQDEDSDNGGPVTTEGSQPLANGPRFFHHSEYIDSNNALCQILERFDSPGIATEHGTEFASGWQSSARLEAFKNFIVFTDDRAACEYRGTQIRSGKDSGTWQAMIAAGTAEAATVPVAAIFDSQLLALSPPHFGTADARNYRMYSVVGMDEKVSPLVPYEPEEPLVSGLCSGNANEVVFPGLVYQQLSMLTGGLRYPICQNRNFDAIFAAVATGVTENAKLSCEWEIPAVPTGQVFDRDRVNVRVTLNGGVTEDLFRVDEGACGPEGGWYYDQPVNPTRVLACPATCAKFDVVDSGSVELEFGCETRTAVVK